MPREKTLLMRIADRQGHIRRSHEPSATENVEALMESVRIQLARLLNSRHGMCECLPDYGLPALADLHVSAGDYAQRVQESIRNTIEQYEPRLRSVRVSQVIDEEEEVRTLSFRVEAILVGKSGDHKVWYQTSMAGDGQFDVEG